MFAFSIRKWNRHSVQLMMKLLFLFWICPFRKQQCISHVPGGKQQPVTHFVDHTLSTPLTHRSSQSHSDSQLFTYLLDWGNWLHIVQRGHRLRAGQSNISRCPTEPWPRTNVQLLRTLSNDSEVPCNSTAICSVYNRNDWSHLNNV